MLEKSPVNKISILRSMVEQGEENEPKLIVPQNSVMHIRQKLGLSETVIKSREPTNASKSKVPQQPETHCAYCENMAKNFLYLESLLRSNYDANKQCNLCYSAIKYLEYVNRSIVDIFGSFEDVNKAIATANVPQKKNKVARKAGKRKSSAQSPKSRTDKVKNAQKANIKRQEGGGISSQFNFPRARAGPLTKPLTRKAKTSSSLKTQVKPKKKKLTKKSPAGVRCVQSDGTNNENGAKAKRNKKKTKTTKVIIMKQKSIKIKSKQKREP